MTKVWKYVECALAAGTALIDCIQATILPRIARHCLTTHLHLERLKIEDRLIDEKRKDRDLLALTLDADVYLNSK